MKLIAHSHHDNSAGTEQSYKLYEVDNETTVRRKQTKHDVLPPTLVRDSDFEQFREICGKAVNNQFVFRFIIGLIIINSITMGVATFDSVQNNQSLLTLFETLDTVFLVIFTVELVLQFIYHGFVFFTQGWLLFDLIVISLSWALDGFQVIRAFRIIRALRLVSRIGEMRNIITALSTALPRLSAIILLMCLEMYIFAVMFTTLFKDLYKDGVTEENYFSSLSTTFFTLFQLMTLDSWSSITKEVMTVYPWSWALFIFYIIISSFIVINMIIAVICDSVGEIQRLEMKKTIERVESITSYQESFDAKSNSDIKMLEMKVDRLVSIVEKLLEEKTTTNTTEPTLSGNNKQSEVTHPKL